MYISTIFLKPFNCKIHTHTWTFSFQYIAINEENLYDCFRAFSQPQTQGEWCLQVDLAFLSFKSQTGNKLDFFKKKKKVKQVLRVNRFYYSFNWENWNYYSMCSHISFLVSFWMKEGQYIWSSHNKFNYNFFAKAEWEGKIYFKLEGEQILILRASKTFRCHFLLKSISER